ncbi:MAG: GNAT family N-acetyltransferase [Clostridiales bacterium]|nr:GNAT family N-acetyltransferase [Clostridiales bacterium]
MMRRIGRNELRPLSEFLAEQFYETEPFQSAMRGIDPDKAKRLITEKYYEQLSHSLYDRSDIFVSGKGISGAIIGVDGKNKMIYSFAPFIVDLIIKAFVLCSKEERRRILQNMKPLRELSTANWAKKFCKEAPYILAIIAIEKEARGTGLCREMLEFFFDHAKTAGTSRYISLETYTPENVPLYEHFGFQLAEKKTTADGKVTEYRMIRKTGDEAAK